MKAGLQHVRGKIDCFFILLFSSRCVRVGDHGEGFGDKSGDTANVMYTCVLLGRGCRNCVSFCDREFMAAGRTMEYQSVFFARLLLQSMILGYSFPS